MRIFILVYDISKMAGSEHGVVKLAAWLTERCGHEVTVVTLDFSKGAPAYSLPASVRLERLGAPPYPTNRLRQLIWHARVLIELRALFAPESGAAIIGSWSNLNILLGMLARRDKGNSYLGWENMSYDSVGFLRKALRSLYYRRLSHVFVLTEEDARRYTKKGIRKVTVTYFAYPFYPERGSDCERPRVLSVGRLEPQKGFDYLIEVARRVHSTHPDWQFVINGRGSQEEALHRAVHEAGLDDCVRFVPRTEDIVSLYTSSSIYAMTSRFEGFPMVLLEAMAAGLPCVSFDCRTGPREILHDGEDGYLVPVGDTARFAERLAELMDGTERRRRMGEAARTNVLRFSPESIFGAWNRVIRDASGASALTAASRQTKGSGAI